MSRSLAICKRFHEKAGLVKYCFWVGSPIRPIADQREARYTFSLLPLGNVLVFPDFAHRRLALLPFALLNWSISAPVPVGVLNL